MVRRVQVLPDVTVTTKWTLAYQLALLSISTRSLSLDHTDYGAVVDKCDDHLVF